MTTPLIICWGELLWDLFEDDRRLGGCAGNVAYHVAQLEGRSLLVSRVGDDELGAAAVRSLAGQGVDTRFVQTDPAAPTGSVRVRVAAGEPRFAIAERAAWDHIEWDDELGPIAAEAAVVVYGTLAQRTPLNSMALEKLFERCDPSCKMLCDLNVRPRYATANVLDAAIERADACKLNEAEAEHVRKTFGVADAIDYLLEARSVELVALTRGKRGAVLCSRTERIERPGVPVDSTEGDAVGAGDAFTAVLAAGLARGASLGHLCDAANRYASYVASQRGATPPVPPSVRDATR